MRMILTALPAALAFFVTVFAAPRESDASIANVTLTSSFVGCDGTTATYHLEANKEVVGGAFSWSHGVTPLTSPTADPNFATTSFAKWEKRVTVTFWHPIGIWDSAQVTLPNPCL